MQYLIYSPLLDPGGKTLVQTETETIDQEKRGARLMVTDANILCLLASGIPAAGNYYLKGYHSGLTG